VYEFDWVFNRQNVVWLVVVDVIDHRREGGRFTRACWSGNQHDSSGMHRHVLENRRRAQIIKRQNLGGDDSEHGGRAAILVVCVDAKAGELWNFEGKIGLKKFFIVLALLVIHDVVHHAIDVFMGQRRHVDTLDVAIDTNHRRHTARQVQVGGIVLYRERQ